MIYSFDIETFNEDNILKPYCVSMASENGIIKSFYGENCINEFLEFLEKDGKNEITLFSHNLTFDGSIIIQNIDKKIKINGILFKGVIYGLTIYCKRKINLKCSYKFFPTKLENANKILECSSKKEFDHKKINRENIFIFKKEVIEYCERDATIVIEIIKKYDEIVKKFVKEWKDFTFSLSGVSLLIYKKNFNIFKIETSCTKEDNILFRDSYFGGRCEIFGNPEKDDKIYHFDFSGMYAQVMKDEFNYGEYEIINYPERIEKNGFFYIKFNSNMEIPVLPSREDNKLLFRNGKNEGLYWWEEINLFEKMGGEVIEILFQIKFKKSEKIFFEFIEKFHNMRKIDKIHNIICKFISNSVYGRLGMNEKLTETKIMDINKYKKWKIKNESLIKNEILINKIIIIEYEKREKTWKKGDKNFNESDNYVNSNVCLAAMITSKARIKLYKGFISVIENKGRVLYCDTDSIFASFKENMDNKKIGEVFFDTKKKETKILKALFALPKAYSLVFEDLSESTKIKGINNIDIRFEKFEKALIDKTSLEINMEILKKSKFIITPKSMKKIIKLNNYNKRIFDEKMIFTKPLIK